MQQNNSPSAARIRDNQRRSRSRRAGVIQELQLRVREYELKGVAASVEMQQAAREVMRENIMLRTLLAQHNIPQDLVDSHLKSCVGHGVQAALGTTTESTTASEVALRQPSGAAIFPHASPSVVPINANNIRPYDIENWTVYPHHVSLRAASGIAEELRNPIEHDTNFLHSNIPPSFTMIEPTGHTSGNDKSDDEPFTPDTSDYSQCPNDDECFCAPTMDHEHDHASPATEMSCETAAAILADLRRDADMDIIRTWLGCSQGGFNEAAECTVKISTVLQIME